MEHRRLRLPYIQNNARNKKFQSVKVLPTINQKNLNRDSSRMLIKRRISSHSSSSRSSSVSVPPSTRKNGKALHRIAKTESQLKRVVIFEPHSSEDLNERESSNEEQSKSSDSNVEP